ncbi:MAG: hypothetical protein WKF66_14145 [Pedobacter sp.]
MKRHLLLCLMIILPLLGIAQKINIQGVVPHPKADKIIFERLKTDASWKVWKGSVYEADIDSSGRFSLSFSIANNGYWKISVGKKKLKLHLNTSQNVYLEFDSNLVITKIIRQELIDSPVSVTF